MDVLVFIDISYSFEFFSFHVGNPVMLFVIILKFLISCWETGHAKL
jgi:hypothetical protein